MKPNINRNIKNYVKIGTSVLSFLVMKISLIDVSTESSLDKWHIRSIYAKRYKKRQIKGSGDDN